MYFAYVDETGTDGASPLMVMIGVVVNDERLNRTQDEFAGIFSQLDDVATGTLKELKSKDLFAGNRAWSGVEGEERRAVVTQLCEWLVNRKHHLALAAVDHAAFRTSPPPVLELTKVWQAGAFHVALQLQRAHQKLKGSKGKTVLVFDDNKQGIARLAELVYSPPAWSDDFYDRKRNATSLDRMIDTPFAVQSHHVGLVQAADVFAAVFRRYAELTGYKAAEKYPGERGHYTTWVSLLAPRLLARSNRWPRRTESACASWYTSIAPRALLALNDQVPPTSP